MSARILPALLAASLCAASAAHAQKGTKENVDKVAPPSGAEVGKAIDAMAASCSKALELHTEIAAATDKLKSAQASRAKSGAEVKKRMRAVSASQAKVARASKKPGGDAAAMVEAAKGDYEAALAESKTYEVETKNIQELEDQLLKLVARADQASSSCSEYEDVVQAAARHAKRAVSSAKRDAAKARHLSAVREEKALLAAREKQSKELAKMKEDTDKTRATLEAMKEQATKASTTAPADKGTANKDPKKGGSTQDAKVAKP